MRVIREFKCLRSGRLYLVGSDYPENDPDRVNELWERGFLEGCLEGTNGFPEPDNGLPEPDNGLPESMPDEGSETNAGGGKAGAARQRRGV